jgi:hypothetical protein
MRENVACLYPADRLAAFKDKRLISAGAPKLV